MIQLLITESYADFTHGGSLVGRYWYRDRYKPFLHPLRTPRGHAVTLASPHDHVHHKGLMYALRTPEVNFWEERSTRGGEAVGEQRHEAFEDVVASGGGAGFVERLRWVRADTGEAVFTERREIRLTFDTASADGTAGYRWTWNTSLTPTHDTRLIQSQWSHDRPDGGRVNYHGLGVRLRRDFGGSTGGNLLELDGQRLDSADFTAAMGRTPAEVAFTGSIDETWPVQRARLTIRQRERHGLFVLNQGFAFMAVGPSNLGELEVRAGEAIEQHLEVVVADVSTRSRV